MTKFISMQSAWIMFLVFVLFFVLGELLPFGSALTMAPFFVWIYSIGIESNRLLPVTMKMPLVKFKILLAYATGYAVVVACYPLQAKMPYALPFHFIDMFCLFYLIYFVAKSIRSIELNRPAILSDWVLIFFGLLFYPIGVWFIQPKIQRIVQTVNS